MEETTLLPARMNDIHSDRPSRHRVCLIVGIFFLLTFTVYYQSLFHPFVRWDDGLLIYDNPAVWAITPTTLKRIFTSYDPELYIPLTFLTYQIDFLIGGTNPVIYHLSNLLFHTANAILVAWFIFLLSKRQWVGLACGFLFAVHPLHTEAVAWASARKDVLSTFFFLLTLIGYLRYRSTGRYLKRSIFAFLLALMAKVTVATLPVLLLLLDVLEGRKIDRKALSEKIPFFVLSIVFGIIAIFGKTAILQRATLLEKMLMACKSTVFYLEKIVWPTELAVLYPYVGKIGMTNPDFLWPAISVLILILIAFLSLKKTRVIFFGVLFFLVTISPTFLNFAKGEMDLYFASDRYAYAGSIGILFLIALGFSLLSRRLPQVFLNSGIGVLVLLFAWMAHAQSQTWAGTETLFRNVIDHYPDSHVAHNNLGNAYRRQDDIAQAIEHFEKAIAIRDHPRTRSNYGAALRKQGKMEEALAQYDRAMELDPESKNAHFGLGILYAELGKRGEALQEYQHAIAIDPTYSEVYLNLGALYMQMNQPEQAIEQYQKAIATTPYFAQAYYNLGVAYRKIDKPRQAMENYEMAIRYEPSFVAARINLGIAYYERRRMEEAREQFEIVLRYDPGNERALSALKQIGSR
ncbi:MAG TPA: tetratricopeptide repeat protein [Candidatus Peribacteraceae bacterium]|nr:tetratricopeptide repeat protein [Candidatus Peribacteraceae bacterium]